MSEDMFIPCMYYHIKHETCRFKSSKGPLWDHKGFGALGSCSKPNQRCLCHWSYPRMEIYTTLYLWIRLRPFKNRRCGGINKDVNLIKLLNIMKLQLIYQWILISFLPFGRMTLTNRLIPLQEITRKHPCGKPYRPLWQLQVAIFIRRWLLSGLIFSWLLASS